MATPGRDARGRFTKGGGYAEALAYAVGNIDFLDSEASRVEKYWRLIEEGTHGFIGRRLAGLWGNVGGPRNALIAPGLVTFGAPRGQKFVPFAQLGPFPSSETLLHLGAKRAMSWLERNTTINASGKRIQFHGRGYAGEHGARGVVSKEIDPHRFFVKGAQRFDPAAREMEAIAQLLRRTMPTGPRAVARPQTFRGVPSGFGSYLQVNVLSNESAALGRAKGRMTSFQRELAQVNRELARELAEDAIAPTLRQSLVRKRTSMGQLEAAIVDPRNRFPR